MLEVHILASSSSGNAMVLTDRRQWILLDAGISCRRITQGLDALGCALTDVSAVLLTHAHSDHISGLKLLLKKMHCPVFASAQTCAVLRDEKQIPAERLQPLPAMTPLRLGDWDVTAIPVSHDSPGCCGYRIDTPFGSVGELTDTGYVTAEAAHILPGVDLAILESNYDPNVLRCGSYPTFLKHRILGEFGHLSNADAAQFAVALAQAGTKEIILAHLSEKNNHPALALQEVSIALTAAGLSPRLNVAPKSGVDTHFVNVKKAEENVIAVLPVAVGEWIHG